MKTAAKVILGSVLAIGAFMGIRAMVRGSSANIPSGYGRLVVNSAIPKVLALVDLNAAEAPGFPGSNRTYLGNTPYSGNIRVGSYRVELGNTYVEYSKEIVILSGATTTVNATAYSS